MTIDVEALLEEVVYRYTPDKKDTYLFIVIGAGGTGGYLIPNLARMVSVQNKLREIEQHTAHQIVLLDGDLVEQKNLLRQQFVTPDIGKNKAKVMATRYGRSFGVTIGFREEYLEELNQLDGLINAHPHKIPVFIDCVDNNKTRLLIHEIYKTLNRAIFLSSGNEESAGQVVFSYNSHEGHSSPDYWNIFPNASVDKLPTELSCAEAAESAPQNIHTNLTAANILFGFVNKLLNAQSIDQLMIFFDINSQNNSIYRGTYHDVAKMLQFVPNNKALIDFVPEDYRERKDIDTANHTVEPPMWEDVQVGVLHGE